MAWRPQPGSSPRQARAHSTGASAAPGGCTALRSHSNSKRAEPTRLGGPIGDRRPDGGGAPHQRDDGGGAPHQRDAAIPCLIHLPSRHLFGAAADRQARPGSRPRRPAVKKTKTKQKQKDLEDPIRHDRLLSARFHFDARQRGALRVDVSGFFVGLAALTSASGPPGADVRHRFFVVFRPAFVTAALPFLAVRRSNAVRPGRA